MVSEKFENKSRRTWKPNIRTKRLWSASLAKFLRLRVQAKVLRTIDKVGGLDEYLLGERPGRIKELGMGGWMLRWRIMQTPTVRQRFAEERERLGLPPQPMTDVDGLEVDPAVVQSQVAEYDRELEEAQEQAAREDEKEASKGGPGELTEDVSSRPARPRMTS